MTNEEFEELFRQNITPYLQVLKERNVGRILGYSTTYDGLPTQDINGVAANIGDLGLLLEEDGEYKKGYYEFSTNGYVYKAPLAASTSIVPYYFEVREDNKVDFLFSNKEVYMVHVGEWIHPDMYTRDDNGIHFDQGWTPPNPSYISVLALV